MQLRDGPSIRANLGKVVWKDLVLPITEVTIGDTSIPYNRVWYRMGEAGFAHSGSIQPVGSRSTRLPVRPQKPASWRK